MDARTLTIQLPIPMAQALEAQANAEGLAQVAIIRRAIAAELARIAATARAAAQQSTDDVLNGKRPNQ